MKVIHQNTSSDQFVVNQSYTEPDQPDHGSSQELEFNPSLQA